MSARERHLHAHVAGTESKSEDSVHGDILDMIDESNVMDFADFPLDAKKPDACRVPGRFQTMQVTKFQRKMHPMYSTSNSAYGSKDVKSTDVPTKFFPKTNYFTNTFQGGMAQDFGLSTHVSTSKVHKAFDGVL